ncbi:hypothetical protein NF556_16700 [Ornithinimicrobium faecis]|uniref:ATP-grasp domain-containing protein n=1 Tax=Ornithinimicrobium faecis TaxID=2934158 RepID=A0ABY4YR58_9MICO|nr:hypothetical protein [Ornithinimicrobium sp. HY1793]USQ79237.1 hypothetical protein NF556_16700 [Ornithinimicrobium sp. HY1793]
MSVLIVATEDDVHTRAVVEALETRGGQVAVADLSRFPQQADLSLHFTCCGQRDLSLSVGEEPLDLADIGSIWWRRPQQPLVDPAIHRETHRMFAANEMQEALSGLWHALDVFWINDPARDHVAHRKVGQLRVAHEVSLRIPDTLITNNPDRARSFIDARGYTQVIYKAFSALPEEWRETRLLRPEELALLDNVRYAPVIFQEYVEAVYDLRITVVGEHVFAAAIHSQETSYPVDFRMDMANARVEAVELPEDVCDKLLALMARMGLVYGAIDMRLRPDGEYVFLEINPAGQFLFIEQETGQPIAAAIAETLLAHDREGSPELTTTRARPERTADDLAGRR